MSLVIISHRWQFIFLKPRKVAGTSIHVALHPHCGEQDVITPIVAYNPTWDQNQYLCQKRNCKGYTRHARAAEVRWRLGAERWQRYFKFSVVRNPWDLVVSQYHWVNRHQRLSLSPRATLDRLRRKPLSFRKNWQLLRLLYYRLVLGEDTRSFPIFVKRLLNFYPHNDGHYFDRKGRQVLDHYIRFEHLESDFAQVCRHLGLSPSSTLPSLKSKSRPKRGYADYYDAHTKELVAQFYRRQIETFGYEF